MSDFNVEETMHRFLIELYLSTRGDSSVMVSMYDIGDTLGLNRDVSLRTAEELIGTGLAEIKTLSGGIGITSDGVIQAQQFGAAVESENRAGVSLGDTPVLDETSRGAVERISNELKNQVGSKGLNFDQLAEMMADLKSIDAQLSSPNPKTAIIRECLQSIKGVLQAVKDADGLSVVTALLGE